MPKLRKMLGDMNAPECLALMRLMETQSAETLAAWAVDYAKNHYLSIYEKECPADTRFRDLIAVCEAYIEGKQQLNTTKLALKEGRTIARDIVNQPVAQAAARAISTACATIQTPTSALGFLLYGAAAVAYEQAGLHETVAVYDALAMDELKCALSALQQAAVPNEPQPAKLNWYC